MAQTMRASTTQWITYPFAGNFQTGFGMNFAVGHRFDSRKGPYEILFKYNLTTSMADDGEFNYVDPYNPSTAQLVLNDGSVRLHELYAVVRFPSTLIPVDFMQIDNLYYDLGMGVGTLVYDYDRATWDVTTLSFVDEESRTITRSGLAFNLGVGYRHALSEDLYLTGRLDANFCQIQDIENTDGDLVHPSPETHNLSLSIGVVKYFSSLF